MGPSWQRAGPPPVTCRARVAPVSRGPQAPPCSANASATRTRSAPPESSSGEQQPALQAVEVPGVDQPAAEQVDLGAGPAVRLRVHRPAAGARGEDDRDARRRARRRRRPPGGRRCPAPKAATTRPSASPPTASDDRRVVVEHRGQQRHPGRDGVRDGDGAAPGDAGVQHRVGPRASGRAARWRSTGTRPGRWCASSRRRGRRAPRRRGRRATPRSRAACVGGHRERGRQVAGAVGAGERRVAHRAGDDDGLGTVPEQVEERTPSPRASRCPARPRLPPAPSATAASARARTVRTSSKVRWALLFFIRSWTWRSRRSAPGHALEQGGPVEPRHRALAPVGAGRHPDGAAEEEDRDAHGPEASHGPGRSEGQRRGTNR